MLMAALALLAGLAQATSIANGWNGQPVWWLQVASLALLVGLLQRARSARTAALWGWLFATAWIAASTWWLYISLHEFGGLAAPLAVLAVLALAAALALYYGLACGLYFSLNFESNKPTASIKYTWSAIVFAALWLLAELARDRFFTGFPWGAGAYAQIDGPWVGWVKFIGVYGLGALLALLAALLAGTLAPPTRRPPGRRAWHGWGTLAATLLLVQAGSLAAQHSFSVGAGRLSVALLQGNIAQGEKFDNSRGVPLALQWYAQQWQASTAALTVAPETAIPVLPRQLPEGYWDALQQRFASGPQAALIGIPLGNSVQGYTNSVIGLKPGQARPYVYSKHHLVPFGEFTPHLFRWFTQMLNIPLGDFNRGALGQPPFDWRGQRMAVNICYEDLFGDELALRFANPTQAPSMMVNVSNIAWFGGGMAIDQHLAISRMRALEFERPMVRATNTGPTVIIDYQGRVAAQLPRLTRAVLAGEVEGRQGLTPFAWWAARWGFGPLWLLAGAIVLIAAYIRNTRAS